MTNELIVALMIKFIPKTREGNALINSPCELLMHVFISIFRRIQNENYEFENFPVFHFRVKSDKDVEF